MAKLDARLCEQMAEHDELIELLSTIPDVERTTARVLIAELGTDMTQFPTPAHAASWAGLCPGNAESAGKRFSGKTRKGDRYLRRILVQSAWGAARTKDCFLAGLFYRIGARRGMKKAAMAVAHRILTIAWQIIRDRVPYREQGRNAFDRRNPLRTARKLSRRLERIGFSVQLTPKLAAEMSPPPTVVSPGVCARCAEWKLSNCIHLIKGPKRRKR